MTFSVLDAIDKLDYQNWNSLVYNNFSNEPMALPEYLKLFCNECEKPMAMVFSNNNSCVLYPFILRKIYNTDFYDVISGYGYGGPYVDGIFNDEDWEEVWKLSGDWFLEHNVITEVIKFSLFTSACNYTGNQSVALKNIVCDLGISEEELINSFDRKVRKNLRRANQYGLEFFSEKNMNHLEDFLNIYYATMERRNADDSFYFKKDFFEMIDKKLNKNYEMFYVIHDKEVISTELALISDNTMYSYLGGTNKEFYAMRPNDFLKVKMMLWAKEKGVSKFVLGGGHGKEDGVYEYKRSFAPHGVVDFKIGTRIFDFEVYKELCEKYGKNVKDEFVPAYRK